MQTNEINGFEIGWSLLFIFVKAQGVGNQLIIK